MTIEELENIGKAEEKINELRDFIHEAFCVDGTTRFYKYTKMDNVTGIAFQIEDKKRGLFFVSLVQP